MSERKKAYRAKKPSATGAIGSGKLSDRIITEMVKNMENIHAAVQKELAAYQLSLEYTEDDNAQMMKLHLFDRAARRYFLARHAFNRAYKRQPDDFARIIAESVK